MPKLESSTLNSVAIIAKTHTHARGSKSTEKAKSREIKHFIKKIYSNQKLKILYKFWLKIMLKYFFTHTWIGLNYLFYCCRHCWGPSAESALVLYILRKKSIATRVYMPLFEWHTPQLRKNHYYTSLHAFFTILISELQYIVMYSSRQFNSLSNEGRIVWLR